MTINNSQVKVITDLRMHQYSFWTIEILISVWYQLPYTEKTRDVKCAIVCFCTPLFFIFSFPHFWYYSYSYSDSSTIIILTLMLLEAIATSRPSLSLLLPYASECICCWIDCLALIFIDSLYFFIQIGTHYYCCSSSKPKNKAEKQHFDLLLPPPLLQRLCCCFETRYVPQIITFIESPLTEFSLIF